MLNFDFSGKNIVITGGIRGIGYSVAKLFSSYSSNMVLGYRSDQDLAESVQSELSLGNSSVKTLRADLASQNECDRFMKESLDFLS